MKKKYKEWYGSLTPLNKLSVSFLLNYIFWLIAWLIAEKFYFDETHSWAYHLFHAGWMSFFTTIPFNRDELKQMTTPQKTRSGHL